MGGQVAAPFFMEEAVLDESEIANTEPANTGDNTGNNNDIPAHNPPVAADYGIDNLIEIDEDTDLIIDVMSECSGDGIFFEEIIYPIDGNKNHEAIFDVDDLGNVTFTPKPDYFGTDTFRYVIRNNNDESDEGEVIVNVNAVNDEPVWIATRISNATQGQEYTFDLKEIVDDPEDDRLTFTATVLPGWFTLSEDGIIKGTPQNDDVGPIEFIVSVDDIQDNPTIILDIPVVTTHELRLIVINVNDEPAANDYNTQTNEDEILIIDKADIITNSCNDIDGDALFIEDIPTQTLRIGDVVDNGDGTITYTPMPDMNGDDWFSYTVNDGNGGTASANVLINVRPMEESFTSYYVDTSGSDANDGLTAQTAFRTVQKAISVVDGPVDIYIEAGIYNEASLNIPEDVALIGTNGVGLMQDSAILDGGGENFIIFSMGDGSSVQGVVMRNANYCIQVQPQENWITGVIIQNNLLYDFSHGINYSTTICEAPGAIINNTIDGFAESGDGFAVYGISVRNCPYVEIKNNIVTGTELRISLSASFAGVYDILGTGVICNNNVYKYVPSSRGDYVGYGELSEYTNNREVGEISQDPLFIDRYYNYYLHPDSPCLGAGEGGANIGAYGAYDMPEASFDYLVKRAGTSDQDAFDTAFKDDYGINTYVSNVAVVDEIRVKFTNKSNSNIGIASYAWDFDGDGGVDSTDIDPRLTYDVGGIYKHVVTLEVTDINGVSSQAMADFNVIANAYTKYMPWFNDKQSDNNFQASLSVTNVSESDNHLSITYKNSRPVEPLDDEIIELPMPVSLGKCIEWSPRDHVTQPDFNWGSIIIESPYPIVGRLAQTTEIYQASTYGLELVKEVDVDRYTRLYVPWYVDNPDNGYQTFVAIFNPSDTDTDIWVTYFSSDLPVTSETRRFTLGAGKSIAWRPHVDDPAEGHGRDIENTSIVKGAIKIVSRYEPIVGRVAQVNPDYGASAYILPYRKEKDAGTPTTLYASRWIDDLGNSGHHAYPAIIDVSNGTDVATSIDITYISTQQYDINDDINNEFYANVYTLEKDEPLAWRPVDDVIGKGNVIPNSQTITAGALKIEADDNIVGRIIRYNSEMDQFAGALEEPLSTPNALPVDAPYNYIMYAPYFHDEFGVRDNNDVSNSVNVTFINMVNTSNQTNLVEITYIPFDSNTYSEETRTFELRGDKCVWWRPHYPFQGGVDVDTISDPIVDQVPRASFTKGSISIKSEAPIIGRVHHQIITQDQNGNDFQSNYAIPFVPAE